MPKVQQCIELNTIQPNQTFETTNYSNDLSNEINKLITEHHTLLYHPNTIPLATLSPNHTSIIEALDNQYYKIESNENYWVTCNPFHHQLRMPHQQKKLFLTTPDIFIDHLAHQWPGNPIEGIWKIIHFYGSKQKSTDIHICTNQGILFKKNGVLQNRLPISDSSMPRLIYLIKLKSHMDPAMSQRPQDGAYCFNCDHIKVDIRTSTLPTQNGEMVSLRLFHEDSSLQTLDHIGFSKKKATHIRSLLNIPNGLILITGTTGSGKSTTLYAMLRELTHRHVITLEDPIERIIPGIHQTSINQWQNYTMDNGLRAILRHNPEVIAIGEIRDNHTADAVINAAYSGHLVIASLHTNSIEATLLRLSNLGVSPFLISYCLRGIIAQSLTYDHHMITLNSQLLICETPYIINNIKKELTAFLKHNTLIE